MGGVVVRVRIAGRRRAHPDRRARPRPGRRCQDRPVRRVVVLADTHLGTGSPRVLPAAVLDALAQADLVVHAGDLLDASALEAITAAAPGTAVHAVRGNHDRALTGLPDHLLLDVEGVRIGVVHDPGPNLGRARRLHRRFPGADVVVFGHTHAPALADGVRGQRLFNPGSPTVRRRAPQRSFGVVDVERGRIVRMEVVALGT
jgi:putative phosphoesterase